MNHSAPAERLEVSSGDPASVRLAAAARHWRDHVIDLTCLIAAEPAPTFHEAERAAMVADLMRQHGYEDVELDDMSNVIGVLSGEGSASEVLLAAHTDTVFPIETPIHVVRSDDRVAAPGIGDNSLGVAAVIALPMVLRDAGVALPYTLAATGNVGEEGLGDLRGIRAVLDRRPGVAAMVAVEGHNLGRVTNVAVGSRRLRVTLTGPGGHSWGDAGRPSAIHAGGEMVAQLGRIRLHSSPKTTLNVGTIAGGISVNTIAPDVTFVLDLRSTDAAALADLEARVREVLRRTPRGIDVTVDVIGDRPAGHLPSETPLMQDALAVLRGLGVEPVADASSTDANVPISRGIPALCIGLTVGGNVHRTDEFIEIAPVAAGLYQMAALTIAIGQWLA